MLLTLHIENLRIFKNVFIDLCPNLNFFCGGNGSGKSSLVEAITILTRGKSYRTKNLTSAINYDEKYFRVMGRIHLDSASPHIGVEKTFNHLKIRLNEQSITSLSKIAEILPVQVIDSENTRLVQSTPVFKRNFLNWGCFHVDSVYKDSWVTYNKIHKQINSSLKKKDLDLLRSWYPSLINAANYLHQRRLDHFNKLDFYLNNYYNSWFGNRYLSVVYKKGWSEHNDFQQSLYASERQNLFNEVLIVGPHRANFIINIEGRDASMILSKGQQKMLAFALLLCQVKILISDTGAKPIVLIDDLASELDMKNISLVLGDIVNMKVQSVVTSINTSTIKKSIDCSDAGFFEVQSGDVRLIR